MEIDNSSTCFKDEVSKIDKNDPKFIMICENIMKEMSAHELTILGLIQKLNSILLDHSPNTKEMGVLILTYNLEHLTADFLNYTEVKLLCTFYTDRLKDHHQVIPAVIRGLVALVKCKQFSDNECLLVLTALFTNIACQQQQHSDRYNIYVIFERLLERHPKVIVSMGLDYVYGIISSIDSERDPRNLYFLFSWLPKMLKNVSLAHLTEEMFEVMACYFPVDFRVPQESTNGISRESLANALSPCLCAVPEFAEYCIPLALEKLNSTLHIAKLDSLRLLKQGCGVFDHSTYHSHSADILYQIQREILDNKDEIQNECLATLSMVILKLSEKDEDSFKHILKNIYDTLKGNLLPDSKFFNSSVQILLCITSSSESASAFLMPFILSLLVNVYNITNSTQDKIALLNSLVSFTCEYSKQNNSSDIEEINSVLALCMKAAIDIDQSLQTTGFESLTQLSHILPANIRNTLYKYLENLLVEKKDANLHTTILKCFRSLAKQYEQEITSLILRTKHDDLAFLNLYLQALCCIADLPHFTENMIDIILSKLNNSETGNLVLENLKNFIAKERSAEVYNVLFNKQTIEQVVDFTLKHASTIKNNTSILFSISFILKSIIAKQNPEVQKVILNNHILKINGCEYQECYVILLDGFMSHLQRDVEINDNIVTNLLDCAILNENVFIRDVSMQLIANLINKCQNDHEILSYIKENSLKFINDKKRSNVVLLLSWITKALFMKNHNDCSSWSTLLFNLLDNDLEVAKGFRIVMCDSYDAFGPNSFCTVRLLYRQKFFTMATDFLVTNYEPYKATTYLPAVGYLLEFAPQQSIILQFKKLKKMILLCLEHCMDHEVISIILKIIDNCIITKEPIIEEYLEDFVPRMIKLSTFETKMAVRILVIRIIKHISECYPVYKLLPLKDTVIRHLEQCIDDKKRLVRKEAVETRSMWFLLDAPL